MSDHAKPGPVISETIEEVQGIFPSDAALQDAVGRLTRAGFDRAALSLPSASPPLDQATPNQGAANPDTEDDVRQLRTLGSSTAGIVGAAIGAGLTVASGGAALPAFAAAAGLGLVTGGGVFAAGSTVGDAQAEARSDEAASGRLVLSVALRAPEDAGRARAAMQDAGASRVETVQRQGAGIAT